MSDYDNTNTGALFINKRKESDKHPNLNGSIDIEGIEYWVSGWTNTIQNGERQGEKMIKLAATPKDARPAQVPDDGGDMDENIPFN